MWTYQFNYYIHHIKVFLSNFVIFGATETFCWYLMITNNIFTFLSSERNNNKIRPFGSLTPEQIYLVVYIINMDSHSIWTCDIRVIGSLNVAIIIAYMRVNSIDWCSNEWHLYIELQIIMIIYDVLYVCEPMNMDISLKNNVYNSTFQTDLWVIP